LVFVLHLSLPIWFAFIPKNLEGLGAGVAIVAKTPRSGVGLERGVSNREGRFNQRLLSPQRPQRGPTNESM
jgi:hypothetical protein